MQTESLVHAAPVPASPNTLASAPLAASSPASVTRGENVAWAWRSGSGPVGASGVSLLQPHAMSTARQAVQATQGSQRRGQTSGSMSTA
jgi:hypothetical protein